MKLIGKLRSLVDNGMSMYLVITLALFALFGVAFTASLVGLLPFRPLDIVLSLVIFMGVSFGASYIFAYLFGVTAHHKSALITGGILFCIFSPVITMKTVLLYSLIASIAIASKYLLIWRGRHIFNPAAIAAVIVLIAGVQSASWWIADSMFAIPVALLAFIVLYKTEKLQFAGTFLLVYVAVLSLVSLVSGQSIGLALASSLGAWFPAFFVGFMLSEPLTLPPRHYQQLLLAGSVAVLIGLHPNFGSFYLTPELALAIGNLASFLIAPRVGISLRLSKRQAFAGDQELYEFVPKRKFNFRPGQYLELNLPHSHADLRGERRMFTIAAAPESKVVRITTRYAEKSSTFKAKLRSLKHGDIVSATMIRGDFLLSKNSSQKLLLIAGGIGITPFLAQLESLQMRHEKRDIVLLYSVRGMNEVLFKDLLLSDNKSIKTIIVAPDAKKGRKNEIKAKFLTSELMQELVPDITERNVYISGSPAMVGSLQAAAKSLGAKHIKTDSFMGY